MVDTCIYLPCFSAENFAKVISRDPPTAHKKYVLRVKNIAKKVFC